MSIHDNMMDGSQKALMASYLESLALVERLHRLLLDVIKDEFERLGVLEINSVQALLLLECPRQLTAPHELHPVLDAMGAGKSADFAQDGHAAIFQRMRLEHQMVMRCGPFGKAFNHDGQKLGHRAERRMHLKTCIMFQL